VLGADAPGGFRLRARREILDELGFGRDGLALWLRWCRQALYSRQIGKIL